MNRLHRLFMGGLIAVLLFPALLSGASSSPLVPITYPGDTDETIQRRAKWIEGAKKEGALDWWGVTRPPEAKKVFDAFMKVYPFIKVNYWRGEGEETAARLEASFLSGTSAADIALGGEPVNYVRWRKMGLIEPFVHIIPNIKNWDKRRYSRAGDNAQAGNNAITPQFNTRILSAAQAPKSWDDLLDPKWKGKLGLPIDPKTWWTFAIADGGWGVEKAEAFIRKLKAQNPIMCKGMSQGHALLLAGEFPIYTNDYLRHVLQSQKQGAPVEWARVSPIPITGPSITLQSRAAHPNAARLYIEWFFSPAGARVFEDATSYGIAFPGSDTALSRILEGHELIVRTEDVVLKAVEMGLDSKFGDLLVTQ